MPYVLGEDGTLSTHASARVHLSVSRAAALGLIHKRMHTHIHACIHTCMHAHIHAYMYACMHAYKYARMHTYIHTYINASIHPSMHACTHTYIYINCVSNPIWGEALLIHSCKTGHRSHTHKHDTNSIAQHTSRITPQLTTRSG